MGSSDIAVESCTSVLDVEDAEEMARRILWKADDVFATADLDQNGQLDK